MRSCPTSCGPSAWAGCSGFGWGLGYVGGLISLFAVLAVHAGDVRLAASNDRRCSASTRDHELERLVGPASALWLAVFVLPMFLFTPDLAPAPAHAAARVPRARAAGRC